MATITDIGDVEVWFKDERPSYNKMVLQVTNKINTLIQNQIAISNEAESILAGPGADQAVVVFALPAAPGGWTREASFTTGAVLRVTDGSTVPPGVAPVAAGGSEGGSWTVSGVTLSTLGAHTHEIGSHSHTIAHNHSSSSHFHTMGNHTHTFPSHSHTISTEVIGTINTPDLWGKPSPFGGAPYYDIERDYHSHVIGNHNHGGNTASNGGTTGTLSTNNTATAAAVIGTVTTSSGTLSTTSSGSNGDHTHAVTHDGLWVPKYATTIVCSKD